MLEYLRVVLVSRLYVDALICLILLLGIEDPQQLSLIKANPESLSTQTHRHLKWLGIWVSCDLARLSSDQRQELFKITGFLSVSIGTLLDLTLTPVRLQLSQAV
jgi:hypothetical protein